MYIYPDNMKGKANLFLWRLYDIAIIIVGSVLAFVTMATLKLVQPAVGVALFAFLTIRFEDLCLFDYLRHATKFCISTQQRFDWRFTDESI